MKSSKFVIAIPVSDTVMMPRKGMVASCDCAEIYFLAHMLLTLNSSRDIWNGTIWTTNTRSLKTNAILDFLQNNTVTHHFIHPGSCDGVSTGTYIEILLC